MTRAASTLGAHTYRVSRSVRAAQHVTSSSFNGLLQRHGKVNPAREGAELQRGKVQILRPDHSMRAVVEALVPKHTGDDL